MKKINWKPYVGFILLTEAVGALAGFLTRGSMPYYDMLQKSVLTPPNIVFPIAWAVLFFLLGWGAARIYTAEKTGRQQALIWFGIQLAVNFVWSLVFFNLHAFGFAFFWLIFLWILILKMILSFKHVDRTAAYLQIPYLFWVAFAGYLNYVIWLLN